MTVLLTLHAAAKLTSSGSTVRSTLPSWTTSGALVVDIGSLRAMTQVISVASSAGGINKDGTGSTTGVQSTSRAKGETWKQKRAGVGLWLGLGLVFGLGLGLGLGLGWGQG